MSDFRHGSLLLAVAMAMAALAASCLTQKSDPEEYEPDARCATCHGDPTRPGDTLLRSAPPRDLSGASDPSYPGVGAHLIHLQAGETHAAIPCNECHVVPARTDSPGHADSARPAELSFGVLARAGRHHPEYRVETRRCSDSYCHRDADAVWTEPRTSEEACGSCHGLPPPAPHPQSERCSACHGDVIDSARNFIDPARHVDGIVDFAAGKCSQCHGSGDDPAPPSDTHGNVSVSALGVGAHQAHLTGGSSSRPLECRECHHVPDVVEDPLHVDGLPAEVAFAGIGKSDGHDPVWDRTSHTCVDGYCHAPTPGKGHASPDWTEPGPLACTSCHGEPPPAPHPQMKDCSLCHGDVVAGDDVTIRDPSRHVDGNVDVDLVTSCTGCHGSVNEAPPRDLLGKTSTDQPGVGAHQTHVLGTASSRAVPCGECHTVPSDVLDEGHLDTFRPAEVTFSGAALSFGAGPKYEDGKCAGTPCHGAVWSTPFGSGGTLTTPTWTKVDGSQNQCGSCHGLPPPRHVYYSENCGACHLDIAPNSTTFTHPELHVDGVVTFEVE